MKGLDIITVSWAEMASKQLVLGICKCRSVHPRVNSSRLTWKQMTHVNAIDSAIMTSVVVGGKYPLFVVSCNPVNWDSSDEIERHIPRHDICFCQSDIEGRDSCQIVG